MKLNKGRRSDYRIKFRGGLCMGQAICLIPTIVVDRWRFRAIGEPVIALSWLGVMLWFGEWERK